MEKGRVEIERKSKEKGRKSRKCICMDDVCVHKGKKKNGFVCVCMRAYMQACVCVKELTKVTTGRKKNDV